MPPLRLGVIGCGYWGPNLVRTFLDLPDVSVLAVADRDASRLEHLRSRHPQIECVTVDYRQLFEMGLDAVVVTTPPETHFEIVQGALERGLDVFAEKPLATDATRALRLVELAQAQERILMVGHIGAYNQAVRALKEMIDAGDLGEVRYIDAVRVGLGMFHPSMNVMWDLAPHDISIALYLLGELPVSVSTQGIACVNESIEDVAYVTLTFPTGVLVHSRMSWLDPRKTRRITVVGSQKMAVYDDLESHEKIKVYDKSVNAIRRTDTFGEFQFAYHYGSVVSPYIHYEEPLRVECLHFLECLLNRTPPLTDGRNGLHVVQIIEAAQRSLRQGGVPISMELVPGAVPRVPDVVGIEAPLVVTVSSNGHHGRSEGNGNGKPSVLVDVTEGSVDDEKHARAEA